jgi:glycosyltransferase involved in cell wall biosynthesis
VYTVKHKVKPADYDGQILSMLCQRQPVPNLKVISNDVVSMADQFSEVELNLKAVGDDYTDEHFRNIGKAFSNIHATKGMPDVLLHNGYNKFNEQAEKRWRAKSYPYYGRLAEILKGMGYTVGSIGYGNEYIAGTVNLTELELEESMAAIKGAKLLISNDTGTYHLANALGTRNLAIFTFTSDKKNYDERFHQLTDIIRKDLECSPCQNKWFNNGDFWIQNRKRCRWECRQIEPDHVAKKADAVLRLHNKAIFVIAQRNAGGNVKKCLRSVLSQDYDDIGIVFIDDCSDDDTLDKAKYMLRGHKHTVFKMNSKRQSKCKSWREAVRDCCSNSESVIFWLDGDDYLLSDTAVSEMMECHKKHDVVWSQYRCVDRKGHCRELTHNDIRKHRWVTSHLKTFKKYLFDAIDDRYFYNASGKYFSSAIDQLIMMAVVEMAGPKRRQFYNKVLYLYNVTGNCFHQIDHGGQLANERQVKNQKPLPVYRKIFSFGDVNRKDGRRWIIAGAGNTARKTMLVIVGEIKDHEYLDHLQGLAKDFNVLIRVRSFDKVEHEVKTCDVIVQMDSVEDPELVKHGVPLLARDSTNVAKAINHERTGLVFGNENTLRKFLKVSYENPKKFIP